MFLTPTCDDCHECDNYGTCQTHNKSICLLHNDCPYFEKPDCALVSYHINQISDSYEITSDNFEKRHRGCKGDGCLFRSNLELVSQDCGCDYVHALGKCRNGECKTSHHENYCKWIECSICVTGPCGCSYYEHSGNSRGGSCRGDRCRNEEHKSDCNYRDCEACFGDDDYSYSNNYESGQSSEEKDDDNYGNDSSSG